MHQQNTLSIKKKNHETKVFPTPQPIPVPKSEEEEINKNINGCFKIYQVKTEFPINHLQKRQSSSYTNYTKSMVILTLV